jgi:hypothetical protein
METEVPGFAEFRFSDRMYPGMVAQEGVTTRGRVYTALSHQTWGILDRFEDPVYRRDLFEVYRSDGSKMKVIAYVLPVTQQHLLFSEPWQMDWFIEVHLKGYVSRCRSFYETITSGSSVASPFGRPRSHPVGCNKDVPVGIKTFSQNS